MLRLVLHSTCAGIVLWNCAAAAQSVPDAPSVLANGNDCAVIAAVAKDHYRFSAADSVAPPLWLDDEGSGWAPRCDWDRYGLSFPQIYRPGARTGSIAYVAFRQPRYDSQGALIAASIVRGPRSGMGVECRVRSGVAGWTVSECRNTWIA